MDAQLSRTDPLEDVPLIRGKNTDRSLTDSLFGFLWAKPGRAWLAMFTVCLGLTGMLLGCMAYVISTGIGVWGNNIPVAWAFDIINFVWWIGIGHAGTLISAILLLLQQKWRTSINRFAEAMTLFAVVCAIIFPVLHTGRPWLALYWLFPYPSTMNIWPQFRSPLMWDVFAVSTYGTVSFLFWFLGLIPDLAALRDASTTRARRLIYGIFSLGWRGSAKHWRDWKFAYLLLAGLSTPLVLSVHTIVSFDFAVAQLPGWHATIFPPYFVAGAVFSGFAMVLTLMIPARHFMGLKHVITEKHVDNMCKVIVATGLMVAYGYLMEHFIAWYSGSKEEAFVFLNRAFGPYWVIYWLMMFCNVLVPQIFWFKKVRYSLKVVWVASILINVGMWCERFIIIVTSLHRDFLTSSWGMYYPTWVDICLFIGTMGLFGTLFLLFLRFLPAVSASEVKEYQYELNHEAAHAKHAAAGAH
ncbi:MAG TPA: NrfD/PsrC family molybdoenzyme membrane anchor subunit [Myxococcaceae bacterium]|nr:NrfD/PsrC family molybdoenzyme membrane anchor subunit [Myxococcaceae bacterium]